ncbi:MAG TPA: c-type cytochrome [Thermoanaerobaculia bacterium]|nr:c-type cytochrome [Thermoanaerobaculia bacterium]
MRRIAPPLALATYAALSSACSYVALDNASPEAAAITKLHWWMFWVLGAVGFLVMAAVAAALSRRFARPADDRQRMRAVAVATGVSVLLLLVLLVASVVTGREVATPAGPDALDIEITGHQWWWEIRYPTAVPRDAVVTANEIHVPVGRAARLRLGSNDVIHSLWIPNVDGKRDLIPGRTNWLTFRPRRIGTFAGRCAEFCGYQHAKMGLLLVVQTPADFALWLAQQRQPSAEPAEASLEHGRDVFLAGPCSACHTIRGTPAFGHKAPDLTHLASRATIAAATLPNTTGHLAGWVVDPQRIKPGNRMPPNVLPSGDLLDLVAYLRSLR